jgi:hypothetical protein
MGWTPLKMFSFSHNCQQAWNWNRWYTNPTREVVEGARCVLFLLNNYLWIFELCNTSKIYLWWHVIIILLLVICVVIWHTLCLWTLIAFPMNGLNGANLWCHLWHHCGHWCGREAIKAHVVATRSSLIHPNWRGTNQIKGLGWKHQRHSALPPHCDGE